MSENSSADEGCKHFDKCWCLACVAELKRENAALVDNCNDLSLVKQDLEIRLQAITTKSIEPLAVPISVLREHWLTGVECNHEAKTDVATCYCSVWRSDPQPNIPAAVNAWIQHLVEQRPSETLVEPKRWLQFCSSDPYCRNCGQEFDQHIVRDRSGFSDVCPTQPSNTGEHHE